MAAIRQPKPTEAQALHDAPFCRRAVPRNLLTGEPLRPDTLKMRVKTLATPRRDEPVRYGPARHHRRALDELPPLAYSADLDNDAEDEGGDDDGE